MCVCVSLGLKYGNHNCRANPGHMGALSRSFGVRASQFLNTEVFTEQDTICNDISYAATDNTYVGKVIQLFAVFIAFSVKMCVFFRC